MGLNQAHRNQLTIGRPAMWVKVSFGARRLRGCAAAICGNREQRCLAATHLEQDLLPVGRPDRRIALPAERQFDRRRSTRVVYPEISLDDHRNMPSVGRDARIRRTSETGRPATRSDLAASIDHDESSRLSERWKIDEGARLR